MEPPLLPPFADHEKNPSAPGEPDGPVRLPLSELQAQLDSLSEEVSALRRRDDALKFYLHRIDEELRLAARLQQDFLPKQLPQIGPVRFHTLYRPAGYVSGDLYDVMRLDEVHVGFFLADAVGHGVPAALLTMFIKNALTPKQITAGGYRLLEPGEAMEKLNDALVEQHLTQATFATAAYVMVNTQTLACRFARAGHPNPLLLRSDGTLLDLQCDGGLLGIFPDEIFPTGEIQLRSGDRLFLYSDGIEVAFAKDQTPMDTQQWRHELQSRYPLTAEQTIAELTGILDQESGSLTPRDDLSLVVLEVK